MATDQHQATTPAAASYFAGIAAALATCAIGAGWQIATRMGTATLAPIDLALIRYAIPALLLAPVWLRVGIGSPSWRSTGQLLVLVLGAGLPFGLLGITGASFAPVAHMGTLLPGAIPLFVALLSGWFLRETLPLWRGIGLAVIVCGMGMLASQSITSFDNGVWRGDALFLLAALLWSGYTVIFRQSNFTPWQAAAVINAWSALLVLPLWLVMNEGQLFAMPLRDLLVQGLWQGVLAGVGGLWTYGVAIKLIGPARAAAFGALVPVMAALGGLALLDEPMTSTTLAGVVLTSCGVLLATGIFARLQK